MARAPSPAGPAPSSSVAEIRFAAPTYRPCSTSSRELRPENLGLCTGGAGVTGTMVDRLRSVGVQRLRVPFHSARRDAHDWLVGQPGALGTALRAIRTCVDTGMPVEAEVVVTRPTMPHLEETIDVLTRVGVRKIVVRRLATVDVGRARIRPALAAPVAASPTTWNARRRPRSSDGPVS